MKTNQNKSIEEEEIKDCITDIGLEKRLEGIIERARRRERERIVGIIEEMETTKTAWGGGCVEETIDKADLLKAINN